MIGRPKRIDLIIPLYLEGHSLRRVASETGYSIEGVRQHLKKHNVQVRLPYGAGAEISDGERDAILAEIRKGVTIDEVAKNFGLLPSRVAVLVGRKREREAHERL